MPTLVADLDNTKLMYNAGLADYIWRTEGRRVPRRVRHYSFVDSSWFDSVEHFLDTHAAAVRDGLFTRLRPYTGAPRVLRELHDEGWTIKIATHRLMAGVEDDIVRDTTIQGLANAGIVYDELHFVADKHTVSGDVWIDDKPSVLEDLDRLGLPRIAYHQEYNASVGGVRARSWADVRGLLLKVSEQDLVSAAS